jgi:hypothetical protein
MSGYAYHKQCGKCLGFLTDTRTGKRKVKHPSGRFVSCRPQFERDADLLEKTVDNMLRKFTLDKAGFQKAVNERYAELEDVKALDKAIASADKDLKKINQSLYNLALAVEEGTLRKESLQRRETELYEQKGWIESHRKELTYKRKRADEIVQLKKDALKWRKEHYKYFKSPERFQQMSYDEKVNLYNYFFNGKDENGIPFGIYVEINSNGDMKVELYGRYIVGPNNYEVIKRRPAIYTFRARKTINDKVDDFSLDRTKHIVDKHITYAFNRGQTRC